MASKHDAKKARANYWVMQQNLAKQKGGRPGHKFNEKKLPKPVPPSSNVPAPVPVPVSVPVPVPVSTDAAKADKAAPPPSEDRAKPTDDAATK